MPGIARWSYRASPGGHAGHRPVVMPGIARWFAEHPPGDMRV